MLHFKTQARLFDTAMRKAGEPVTVLIGKSKYITKAIVQNSGKNFMRKYDNEGTNVKITGRSRHRDKVVFLPYISAWEGSDGQVAVLYRGDKFIVLADSVMKLGDTPLYIWALVAEESKAKEGYYDDIE